MEKKTRFRLAIALVFAALGATLLWLYAEQLDDEHEALVADQVEVVKAARNIEAGGTLTKDVLTTERVPRKFLPANPLLESELNIYLGSPVALAVEEGEMILTSHFAFREAPRIDSTNSPGGDGGDGRLLIKTASLQLTAKAPHDVALRLASMANDAGGFVVRSSGTSLQNEAAASLTVRVPATRFDAILNRYRGAATLMSESTEGVDVTDKYSNLQLQARNQRALETKLLSFVDTAKTVEEAIQLEEKIQKYRMEAERLEAQARRLRDQQPLSTIEVAISTLRPAPKAPPKPPEPGMFAPISSAFADAGVILLDITAMLIRFFAALVPFVIILGPLGFAGLALSRRTRRREPEDADV